MITNLFSIFDPSSSILSLSWTLILIPILYNMPYFWNKSSTSIFLQNIILNNFNNEISYTLGKSENGTESIILAVFLTILILNVIALYPHNFAATAHLPITLPLALTIWLAIVGFGWTQNTNHILIHLVPQGTPILLINFMVLIELISNLIRPITLCVRLTANLIAGHLLISLLGSAIISLPWDNILMAIAAPLILTILETAVAGIQAYVFITLIALYTTEVN